MARKRIKVRGFFVDSTSHYGAFHDRYEPILSTTNNRFEKLEYINKMGDVVYMTKKEFIQNNLFDSMFEVLKAYYPDDSVSKFSNKYSLISNLLHSYINRKTLQEQGLSLNVA